MCKTQFGGNIYVRSKFSCVRSSHDLCVRAHARSLEGTLTMGIPLLLVGTVASFLGMFFGAVSPIHCAIMNLPSKPPTPRDGIVIIPPTCFGLLLNHPNLVTYLQSDHSTHPAALSPLPLRVGVMAP